MVELYLLIKWSRQLKAMCREAGVNAWRYQFQLVFLWFGAEFGGLILGLILAEGFSHMGVLPAELLFLLPYVTALFCAAQAIKVPFRSVERLLRQREAIQSEWTCVSCGEPVPSHDSTCPMCGADRQVTTAESGTRDAPDFSFLSKEA